MDLMPFVNKAGCECLNESDDCGFENCLNKEPSYLESDCDEQVSAAELTSPLHLHLCFVSAIANANPKKRYHCSRTVQFLKQRMNEWLLRKNVLLLEV